MGKVLVLYDSASGNTAKMAGLVVEGVSSISEMEVRLRKVEETTPEDVLWCDGLALGSPTNMGLLSWKMKRFWDEPMAPYWMKVDGKIACAFSSSGGWVAALNWPASPCSPCSSMSASWCSASPTMRAS
jgi:NAD(P)H dehydrogenase (quinone)